MTFVQSDCDPARSGKYNKSKQSRHENTFYRKLFITRSYALNPFGFEMAGMQFLLGWQMPALAFRRVSRMMLPL
jgi:hypothetical protein